MNNLVENLKFEIVEKIYDNGLDSVFNADLTQLFPDYSNNQLRNGISELFNDEGIIEVWGSQQIVHDFFLNDFYGFLTDKGILEYEDFVYDETKYSIEIVRFLQVVESTAKKYLVDSEIVGDYITLLLKKSISSTKIIRYESEIIV